MAELEKSQFADKWMATCCADNFIENSLLKVTQMLRHYGSMEWRTGIGWDMERRMCRLLTFRLNSECLEGWLGFALLGQVRISEELDILTDPNVI